MLHIFGFKGLIRKILRNKDLAVGHQLSAIRKVKVKFVGCLRHREVVPASLELSKKTGAWGGSFQASWDGDTSTLVNRSILFFADWGGVVCDCAHVGW